MKKTIPGEYGRTHAVLLPRDPTCLFSYWEVQPQTLDLFRKQFGAEVINSSRPVLRVFEVDQQSGNGGRERLASEIAVSLEARNWYIHVKEPGRHWFVELGLVTPDGRFLLLARSNKVNLPLGRVSDVTDLRWMVLKEGYEQLLGELSGAHRVGRGSLEMAKVLSHRWQMLTGSGFSWKKP